MTASLTEQARLAIAPLLAAARWRLRRNAIGRALPTGLWLAAGLLSLGLWLKQPPALWLLAGLAVATTLAWLCINLAQTATGNRAAAIAADHWAAGTGTVTTAVEILADNSTTLSGAQQQVLRTVSIHAADWLTRVRPPASQPGPRLITPLLVILLLAYLLPTNHLLTDEQFIAEPEIAATPTAPAARESAADSAAASSPAPSRQAATSTEQQVAADLPSHSALNQPQARAPLAGSPGAGNSGNPEPGASAAKRKAGSATTTAMTAAMTNASPALMQREGVATTTGTGAAQPGGGVTGQQNPSNAGIGNSYRPSFSGTDAVVVRHFLASRELQ